MTDKHDRTSAPLSPPQKAPVARRGMTTASPEEARHQPLAYFLAPSLNLPGKPPNVPNPFAGDDAE